MAKNCIHFYRVRKNKSARKSFFTCKMGIFHQRECTLLCVKKAIHMTIYVFVCREFSIKMASKNIDYIFVFDEKFVNDKNNVEFVIKN
jgi:hypothetical protein